MNARGTVFLIPAENPAYGMLCGTNSYVIILGKRCVLIDAPQCQNVEFTKFLRNLGTFLEDQEAVLESVLVTHSHYDHFSGAGDVVNMCKERGWHEPKIFKKVDGNTWEKRRMKSDLKGHQVNDLREG